MTPRDRSAANWVLVGGIVLQCLLFLRVAVLFAPEQYLGPSGADRVFYYAYARSIVIDGDLDFTNEVSMRPPSSGLRMVGGRPLNKYPIGAPLLALPAYALTDMAMRAWVSAPTGYEKPYVYAYALSQLSFAALGIVLLYAAVCRVADPLPSAIGAVGASLGTGLTPYITADLMMAQGAASFSVAWCLLESFRLREQPRSFVGWLRIGIATAFVVIVRLQNVVFVMVPAIAAITAMRVAMVERRSLARRASNLCAMAAGLVLGFIPQALAWRAMFGKWIVDSYSSEASFSWLSPQWVEATRLARWLPLIVVGLCVTLLLAWRRRDPLLAALAASFVGSIYVVLCWWSPGIVARTSFDNLAPVAVGLAISAQVLGHRRRGLRWMALVVPIIWNVPFLMTYYPSRLWSVSALLSEWWRGARLMLGS